MRHIPSHGLSLSRHSVPTNAPLEELLTLANESNDCSTAILTRGVNPASAGGDLSPTHSLG